ncbi:hypothetical protein [Nostoc sp.]|uniref:hypothetical protein n=1 Tax=Nostoc sp. TaxID=1180 RepID=UPI002FFAD470
MNEDLKNKIIKDLEKSGFGAEMLVLKIFNSLGWRAEAGQGYFDKDENKSREIDISAYYSAHLEVNNKFCVSSFFHICAEVKKSEQPWIVFRTYPHPYFQLCAWDNLIDCINLPTENFNLVEYITKHSLLAIKGWEGSGIHHAFKDPNTPSRWYPAFIAACKACEDCYERNKLDGNKTTSNILEEPTEWNFFQPLVILDGTLVTAELTDSGEIHIEEVDSAPFRFKYNTKNYIRGNYRVDLVTISGLKNYIKTIMHRQNNINIGIRNYAPYAFKKESSM